MFVLGFSIMKNKKKYLQPGKNANICNRHYVYGNVLARVFQNLQILKIQSHDSFSSE